VALGIRRRRLRIAGGVCIPAAKMELSPVMDTTRIENTYYWGQCDTLAYFLPPLIETLGHDLNAGATIQSNPSRDIHNNKGIHYITIHSHHGSTYPVMNEEWRRRWPCLLTYRCNLLWVRCLCKVITHQLSLTQQTKPENGSGVPRFHHKGH